MTKKLTVILVISGVLLPSFSFAQVSPEIRIPETLEELKIAGLKALKLLPEFLKSIWQEFLGTCQKIWNWYKKIWNSYIYPFFHNIWQKTLGKEIKERKPIIEEEFKKEKKEMREEIKTELPKTAKSLWEKFKELIR